MHLGALIQVCIGDTVSSKSVYTFIILIWNNVEATTFCIRPAMLELLQAMFQQHLSVDCIYISYMQCSGFGQYVIQYGISDQCISSAYFLFAAHLMIIELAMYYLIDSSFTDLWHNGVFHYQSFFKSNFVSSHELKLFPRRNTETGQSRSGFPLTYLPVSLTPCERWSALLENAELDPFLRKWEGGWASRNFSVGMSKVSRMSSSTLTCRGQPLCVYVSACVRVLCFCMCVAGYCRPVCMHTAYGY